ncbi:MAG: hypothetical protein K9L68_06230 [Spirochaetales bacterium]|nr:hypothetical protein [Spirochaetales bacterium]MCF7938179.1 hypothetical protein [Spirochaetales bacterium]
MAGSKLRIRIIILLFLVAGFFAGPLWSQTMMEPSRFVEDIDLHLLVSRMDEPAAPFLHENTLILSYRPPSGEKARSVSVAFEHERYNTLYPFMRTKAGIYVYTADLDELRIEPGEELIYRLVVDGLWMTDPLAGSRQNIPPEGKVLSSSKTRDRFGTSVTSVRLPDPGPSLEPGVQVDPQNGKALFVHPADPGSRIFLVSDITGWDPFLMPFEPSSIRDSRGRRFYTLEVSVKPGVHHYYLLIDGERYPSGRYQSYEYPLNYGRVSTLEGKLDVFTFSTAR